MKTKYFDKKHKIWLLTWIGVVLLVWLWDMLFLNRPALRQIEEGFINTLIISSLVIVFSIIFAWLVIFTDILINNMRFRGLRLLITFVLNLLRSIPQIIGILAGYIALTYLITNGIISNQLLIIILIALIISVFIFQEIVDLMRERIEYFKRSDFFNAMSVCGISEFRIVNIDILWKNSRIHLLNKLISIFGIAVFLQCSVDFIVSVGLSTDISRVNLPATLGGLLAKIDSKQDILAIGQLFTNPFYIGRIFVEHLQGITIAFLIVFTLLSSYKISNGYSERYRL
jgi:ABC-type dipeptide/oligopeptide/nickel transport system permease component